MLVMFAREVSACGTSVVANPAAGKRRRHDHADLATAPLDGSKIGRGRMTRSLTVVVADALARGDRGRLADLGLCCLWGGAGKGQITGEGREGAFRQPGLCRADARVRSCEEREQRSQSRGSTPRWRSSGFLLGPYDEGR